MVNVSITLQLKRQVWHIVRCKVDGAPETHAVTLSTTLKRKFLSQEAAVRYVMRVVVGRLKHQTNEVAGAHGITCSVTVNS